MYEDQSGGLGPGWVMNGSPVQSLKWLSLLAMEEVGNFGDQPETLSHCEMIFQYGSFQAVSSKDRITVDSEEEPGFHQHRGL